MKLTVINREKLYKREYQRDRIQELTGSVGGEALQESLSRVIAQMIAQG